MRGPLFGVFAFFLMIAPGSAQTTINMFALTGQSNMSGAGKLEEWPSDLPLNPDRLWAFKFDKKWHHPAMEPIHYAAVGPGLAFADHLATLRPAMTIGVIACAQPSTGAKDFQWTQSDAGLYRRCLHQIDLAIKRCPVGYLCQMAGVFHAQGEYETSLRDDRPVWDTWLPLTRAFVASLRQDTGNVRLPIVYTKLGIVSEPIRKHRPYWDQVRSEQLILETTMTTAKIAQNDQILLPYDALHYTTSQQITIGRNAARIMNKLLP